MRHLRFLPWALAGILGIVGGREASANAWPHHVGEQRQNNGQTYVFDSSTAFFNWIMDSGVMNVSSDFFCRVDATNPTLPGAPLMASENIWCVTVGLQDSTPAGVPVLFTRNVRATDLADFRGRIRDTLTHAPPFGTESVVVILNGGGCLILRGTQLDQTWEEVLGMRRMSGAVLRP